MIKRPEIKKPTFYNPSFKDGQIGNAFNKISGFNKQDPSRNAFMLTGPFASKGYDWWWHSFTAINHETGEEKPFFIEFFTCNPALGGPEPILGQSPDSIAENKRPSYLMVKAGCWGEYHAQFHRFFGWDEVNLHEDAPFSISADDCYCSDTVLRGSVSVSHQDANDHPELMCDGGEMSWSLVIDKKIAYNVGYGASKALRAAKAFEMFWHVEGMKSLFEGTIMLNGERYDVIPERSYGYSDKNWGRNFTSPWIWLSSNDLTSNLTGLKLTNSVFDIGGGRPKVLVVPLEKKLLGGFYYEGTEYDYNFSKLWSLPEINFNCRETSTEVRWDIRLENYNSVMETRVSCQKNDMLLINYESPDGKKLHNRLWNGGNGVGNIKLYRKRGKNLELIDDITAKHIGCEYGEYDS